MPNSQKLFAYVRSTRKLEEMDFILDFLAIYLGLEALLVFLFSLSRVGRTAQRPPSHYSVFERGPWTYRSSCLSLQKAKTTGTVPLRDQLAGSVMMGMRG